jgi:anti-sigma B factor antagonist
MQRTLFGTCCLGEATAAYSVSPLEALERFRNGAFLVLGGYDGERARWKQEDGVVRSVQGGRLWRRDLPVLAGRPAFSNNVSVDISSKRLYHRIGLPAPCSSVHSSEGAWFMTIKEKMYGDIAVLSLKGNLMGDPDTTDVRDKIYSLLQDDVKKIVLDMSKVKWINSSGLGTLIAAMTSVKNKGGEMKLAGVTEKVESLFMITQLIKVFKTYENVDRALASFK